MAFKLQTQLFGFEVNAIYMCNVAALDKIFNITSRMVPQGIENTIFLPAIYTFTVITLVLCVAEFFEITFRRLFHKKSVMPIIFSHLLPCPPAYL